MERTLLGLCLASLMTGVVQAMPVTVTFQAGNFAAIGGSDPIPQAVVSGSITYEAPTLLGDITALSSINLTIAGHVYTVPELTFDSSSTTQNIGGLIYGINGLAAGNDFQLVWEQATSAPIAFRYTIPGTNTVFSGSLTQFSLAPGATVPLPASAGLLGLGLGLMGVLRTRSRSRSAG